MDFGTVAELWRYPVSSVHGEALDAAQVAPGGIAGDRIWGIRDAATGEIAAPEMRKPWRGTPELEARTGADVPEVRAPGGTWHPVTTAAASAAASERLGFAVDFAPHTPFETEAPGKVAPRYLRADLHLLTTASLRWLAAQLPDAREAHPRRFRPNLLLDTPGVEGLAEQELIGRRLTVGTVVLRIVEPCARCAFTALGQDTLAFEPAVLHTISQRAGGAFGVLASVEVAGVIRPGDTARVQAVTGA